MGESFDESVQVSNEHFAEKLLWNAIIYTTIVAIPFWAEWRPFDLPICTSWIYIIVNTLHCGCNPIEAS